MMYFLILSLILVIFVHFIWAEFGYIFNRELLKNVSKTSIPCIKVGIIFATLSHEQLILLPLQALEKFKRSFRTKILHMEIFVIVKARDAEMILSKSKYNLRRSSFYRILRLIFGTGLLTSDGEEWWKRKQMLTPHFHLKKLCGHFETFRRQSQELIDELATLDGKIVEAESICIRHILSIVNESILGVKLSNTDEEGKQIKDILDFFTRNWYKVWLLNDTISSLTGLKRQVNKMMEPLSRTALYALEREIKNSNTPKSEEERLAIIDTLTQAHLEEKLSRQNVIDELNTFRIAGLDTVVAAMTFTLMLLANYGDVQQKIFQDIKAQMHDEDEELSLSTIKNLDLLERVLKESLRLYPPGYSVEREITEDIPYEGEVIKKGTLAQIFINALHRDPEEYPNPNAFDPDRFLPENSRERHSFAFIPFSAGTRSCIGQKFAMLQLKTLLACVIRKFKILPGTRHEDVVLKLGTTLATTKPIEVKFVKRQ